MAAKKSEKKVAKDAVAVDSSMVAAVKAPRARKAAAKAPVEEILAAPVEVAAPVVAPAVTVDAVRTRAHAIHLAEGGSALDNWLRAERELAQ